MRSFRSDPYLWIHLAGVAALPIFLEICFLGLAAGNPSLPVGLELLLITAAGVAPVLWMQWQRPFCIFSLLLVALKPRQLTDDQRKLLRLFKSQENRAIAILVPIILVWVLWQLYRFAPIAADITPFHSRGVGLLVAAIAFMASNLFSQVPASIVPILFTDQSKFTALEPYPVEKIPQDFFLLGFPVTRILPDFIVDETVKEKPARAPVSKSAVIAAPEPTATEVAIAVEPEVEAREVEAYAAPEPDVVSPFTESLDTGQTTTEESPPAAEVLESTIDTEAVESTVIPAAVDLLEGKGGADVQGSTHPTVPHEVSEPTEDSTDDLENSNAAIAESLDTSADDSTPDIPTGQDTAVEISTDWETADSESNLEEPAEEEPPEATIPPDDSH